MWEIDILEYVGREPDIILLLYTHKTVMEIQSTQKKQGLKILKRVSYLCYGLV
jgi:hypothetical protein